jgi:hypothetical protein
MSNHITIELCQEDRERLDLLRSTLVALGDLLLKGQTPVAATQTVQKAEEVNEHPVDAVSPHGLPEPVAEPVAEPLAEPVAEPVAEPEAPKFTKDDVLAKVQKLAGPNNPKREQAKAIVKSYGAKVSDIPKDKYPEVMAKLAELEG